MVRVVLVMWPSVSHFTSQTFHIFTNKMGLFHQLVSDSVWPYGLQHARFPCPSLSLKVCSNSCLLSWWCHPTISSSATPFSFCPQSFPASESCAMSWLFTSGRQSIGASASASVFPMNIQGWFPLGLTDLIFWESKDSQGSSPGSSVHGILQARILEWVAIPFSKVYSQLRDQTWVYCIASGFFTIWATREAL